jgi:hypothetical protein
MGIQPGKTKDDAVNLLREIKADNGGRLTILDTGIIKYLNNASPKTTAPASALNLSAGQAVRSVQRSRDGCISSQFYRDAVLVRS